MFYPDADRYLNDREWTVTLYDVYGSHPASAAEEADT